MAKILYMYAVGAIDGVNSQARHIINAFKQKHTITVLDAREYSYLQQSIVKTKGILTDVYITNDLTEAVIELDPDYLFVHVFDQHIYSTIIKLKNSKWDGRIIWRFGANPIEHFLVYRFWPLPNPRPVYLTNMVKEVDMIIAPSEYAGNTATFLGAEKVVVIPPCVDVNSYIPTPYEGKRIVAVGRFQPANCFFAVLNAFRRIATEFPDTKLTLIGSGSYDSLYRDATQKYVLEDQVRIISDNPAHYQEAADIALVPAVTAMGPNVVALEAMAAGCYTITSATGGLRELKTTIKVNWDSFADWYFAIKKAITDHDMARYVIKRQLQEVEQYDAEVIKPLYNEAIELLEEAETNDRRDNDSA